MTLRLVSTALALALAAPNAAAQEPENEDGEKPSPHRVTFDLGGGHLEDRATWGAGLGAGYGFRPFRVVELGVKFRWLYFPASTATHLSSATGEYAEVREMHLAIGLGSARVFLPLDARDRFELGLTVSGGGAYSTDVCCLAVGLAADGRVRVSRNTGLQLSFEEMILERKATSTPDTGADWNPPLMGQVGFWLSLVQTLEL